MNRLPFWRLLIVAAVVVGVHLAILAWWQQAHLPAGEGSWQVGKRPLQWLRVNVLAKTVPVAGKSDMEAAAVRKASSERDDVSPPAESHPLTPIAPSGEKRPWTPSPSDYLSVEQVDAFPQPQEDGWQLDWSQVPVASPAWRITVRLWVSAAGQIDHVEVLDAQPHADWVKALLAPLARTPMSPALLAGQAVPVTYEVQMAPEQLP